MSFVRKLWFPIFAGVYGVSMGCLGYGIDTLPYWIGLTFGVIGHFGAALVQP